MGRLGRLGLGSKSLLLQIHRHFLSSFVSECHFDRRHALGGGTPYLLRALSSLHGHGFDVVGKPAKLSGSIQLMRQHFHASAERDLYEILGVPKDASRDEIKKAFHALAKKHHPDANKNNPVAKRKFQEIRDAYETLRDPERRAQYDTERLRDAGKGEYVADDTRGFEYAHHDPVSDSFRRIFSEIFEDETESFAADIQVELPLSFAEAAKGCTKHLSFNADVPCDSCDGRGHPINTKPKVCPTCKGIGRVTIPPFTSTCSVCKGHGRIIKDNCLACKGRGVVKGVKEVNVTIPAGVDSGDTIRVSKGGNSGKRGANHGNLIIKLKIDRDTIFVRDGADLYVDSHISFTQAMLGGKVEVPTLSGKAQVEIPNGVQPGQLLVLRGKGLPKHMGIFNHGDQYVRFRIRVPSSVSEHQRTLLEEFAKEELLHENDTSAEGNWWKHIVDRLVGHKFMLKVSFFILILLLLSKA